jgi:exodeoxyribonuclease VII large subunit
MPRGIGVVTSLGAAALHDVATALRRRVPHIPVLVAPALVQGAAAPADLCRALQSLYAQAAAQDGPAIDLILLVRGGGSLEDLWAFNDEQLARTIVASPVPVVSGVGHETDFTIADFCADLRAPTPTAAAELACEPRETWLGALELIQDRLGDAAQRQLDARGQRLDQAAARLGRPSGLVQRQHLRLEQLAQRVRFGVLGHLRESSQARQALDARFTQARGRTAALARERLERLQLRLEARDPRHVLQRGYAWLSDASGHAVTSARALEPGQPLKATLADGEVDLTVSQPRLL